MPADGSVTAAVIATDAIDADAIKSDAVTEIQSGLSTFNAATDKVYLANGEHGGSSAVLTFERLIGASTTTNEPAFKLTGNGTAAGMHSIGGATGAGALMQGGATSGDGLRVIGPTSGHGISAAGVGASKNGVSATSGLSSGIHSSGTGTSAGLELTGGTLGPGMLIVGGATSGDGIDITTSNGHGIVIGPGGSSKHGIYVSGGSGGTSDAICLIAGVGGVGFRTGAIVASTITTSGTVTLNALTVTAVVTAGTNSIPWNAAWDAEVQSEVQDAIEANHLDHLLAADYDPSAKPGIATALLNEIIGNDSGVSQFTANALELAPSVSAVAIRTEIDSNSTKLAAIQDRISYGLTVLVGACADAGTAAETYVYEIGGETFTVDYTGLDATGNRTTTTLSKV
jgi:hypothetical protein